MICTVNDRHTQVIRHVNACLVVAKHVGFFYSSSTAKPAIPSWPESNWSASSAPARTSFDSTGTFSHPVYSIAVYTVKICMIRQPTKSEAETSQWSRQH